MDAAPCPPWLKILDRFAETYSQAAGAPDVVATSAVTVGHTDEQVDEKLSDECRAVREAMVLQMAYVPDNELARAFLDTDGTGPRADALCVVMQRRDVDF
jgi:hypothetical protein